VSGGWRGGDGDNSEHETGAWCAEEERMMGTLRFETLTPSEVLEARMAGVRQGRPHWTAAQARDYSLAIDPALATAYALHPHAIRLALAACATNGAMDVRCYTRTLPIPGASCAEETTMSVNYEDLSVEEQCHVTRQMVDHQVRRYMQAHAGTSYAEALAATLQADPQLKQRYAESWISLPADGAPSDDEASAQRRGAGGEVLRRARAWLAEHAGQGGTLEDAVRVVVAADSQLARAYLGCE
jgi:hypothetical protein